MIHEILPEGYRHGRFRPYISANVSVQKLANSKTTSLDRFLLAVLLSLGVLVRLYKLYLPAQVVFDEVHFGGFALDYFRGEFFIDVHPPLVKLAYYWLALLAGWDGQFQFSEIGEAFDKNVPYVVMRSFPAIAGVASVMLVYKILRLSNCRSAVAFFGAGLVLVENSLVTQSRFIMLDGPLIFFTCLTIYGVKRSQLASIPFSRHWYKTFLITGVALGFTVSTKLTGLFTVLWVGFIAVRQLWRLLGDLEVRSGTWVYHVLARVVTLLAVPTVIYLSIFYVHFLNLPFNGEGSGVMSPHFKSTLADSTKDIPAQVNYGSTITLKHHSMMKYLHSHNHTYVTGSHQQQVTLFGVENDYNNEWIVETKNKVREGELQKALRPVKDGDIIRLFHKGTGRYMRVNDVRPPITEHDYANEVSCDSSREELLGDFNFEFKVRILGKTEAASNDLPLIKLRTAESIFQLIHQGTKCIMFGHDAKLPKWAFGQNEVMCVEEPTIANSLWFIETNSHPLLGEDSEKVNFPKYSFWSKFKEYHIAMFRANSELTDDHEYSSEAATWPFNVRGVSYYNNFNVFSDDGGSQIYLLGNTAIYYSIILVIILVSFKQFTYFVKNLNPFVIVKETFDSAVFHEYSLEYVVGWVIHLIAFFSMERQLFLHHYLSSVVFGILAVSQYIEYRVSKNRVIGYGLMVLLGGASIFCFVQFMPLIYGTPWTKDKCEASRWIPTWDYNCAIY